MRGLRKVHQCTLHSRGKYVFTIYLTYSFILLMNSNMSIEIIKVSITVIALLQILCITGSKETLDKENKRIENVLNSFTYKKINKLYK